MLEVSVRSFEGYFFFLVFILGPRIILDLDTIPDRCVVELLYNY